LTALATVVAVPASAPRWAMICSSIGAPSADAPRGNASLPESVTVTPGVSACGWATTVSLAGAPASRAMRGRSEGSLAYSALPGQAV
jgi:hypothetical protein